MQIDVKFIEPIPRAKTTGVPITPADRRGTFFQYTAIDDHARLRVLTVYRHNNQKTAVDFLDYVLSQLPFRVETIHTHNGAQFQSQFHWHVLDKGIGHVSIKPRTPRLNGKVERSHRIDAEEFYRLLDGVVIDDVNIVNARLKDWQDYYNFDRPHGSLDGQTPYERLRQKTQATAPGVKPTFISCTKPNRARSDRYQPRSHSDLEPARGFEPLTYGLQDRCSAC